MILTVGFWFIYLFMVIFIVEELKAKKVLVKHVETVTSMETTMEIVQSFAVSIEL